MKFKQFVNESETDPVKFAIQNLAVEEGHLRSIVDYMSDLEKNISGGFQKEIGKQLNRDFTVYDKDGLKLDMTNTKLTFFGTRRPDLYLFGGSSRENGDIYNYLYNDGKIHFGFNNLLRAMGEKGGWETVNKVIREPVDAEFEENFVFPFAEEIAQDYIDWLENVDKECRKITKKVYGSPLAEESPISHISLEIEEFLKKNNTPEKVSKRIGSSRIFSHAAWWLSGFNDNNKTTLGGKDQKFWTDIIEDFKKEIVEFKEDSDSKVKKCSKECIDAYAKSISSVLRDIGLTGKSFVVMTGLLSDDGNDTCLYEIDKVSDIEEIKEIWKERRVKERKDYEERRKRDEEYRKKNDWYARYGSKYDF